MDYHHLYFPEIDSTNGYLKNSFDALEDFTFVSAGYQTRGKGRKARSWTSNKGENLLFS